jgi:CubicO group peptidase (beta-lactamase class C family)
MKRWVLAAACLIALSAAADELEDFVHQQREAKDIPGLVLAIVKNGKVDRVVASGKASLDLDVPVKRESAFEIGSLTKAFTAELVMMLVEEGKLSLDDNIGKHVERSPDIWKDVTIYHLLTHTSGLPNYTDLRPTMILTSQRFTYTDLFELVKDKKLLFAPGDEFRYSNTNYYFLGKIIENLTGKTYAEYLKEKILDPLKMDNTTPQKPRSVIKNRAVGYMKFGNHMSVMPLLDAEGAYAAGFLVSTVDDMAKWDKALLEGNLLKPESYKKMYAYPKVKDGDSSYGFGWGLGEIAGHIAIQHGGGTGGFTSYLLRLPEDKLSVIVLSNLAMADVASIAVGAAKFALPALVEKVIRDPDTALTKKHREIMDKLMDGTLQRTPFDEKTAEALFPDRIAQARQRVLALGKIEKVELLEHKHEPRLLTRRYRVIFEKEKLQLVIRENADKKIVAIFLQPD